MAQYSDAYLELYKRGPFAGRIDPWAERGQYFHQIHAGMIGRMLDDLQEPLTALGYIAGRETSLQIVDNRQPDLFIQRHREKSSPPPQTLDYALAAAEALAEPGTVLDSDDYQLDALVIRELQTGELVTVVEVISPGNKTDNAGMLQYRRDRESLIQQQVNVMEIDLTRSVKRLVGHSTAQRYPYHVAVYLPGQPARLIPMHFDEPLKRVALPLRQEVLPINLQDVYEYAYQVARIAMHIMSAGNYSPEELPFPSTLTDAQRQQALETVASWHAESNVYTNAERTS